MLSDNLITIQRFVFETKNKELRMFKKSQQEAKVESKAIEKLLSSAKRHK